MTSVHPAPDREVLQDVEHAHRHCLAALDDPDTNSLAAVTWASAHVAAVEHVLYPVAARTLRSGRERVRTQLAVDHRLQLALWRLDRRLTGDVHLARSPVLDLEEGVRRALRQHADGEQRLVTELCQALDAEQQRALSERLAAALQRGPTRPHPDTRHGRFAEGLGFWLGGAVDRLRDGLDSRTVPTPRPMTRPRPLGRWGAYLLGVPFGESSSRRR